ncbi:hypothetical protein EVAR_78928_1 [Eumeta japonica]|uniref:Uncharacterized protein n=1 Tax=Eumeta variegata TaxID=151549 RepID=A0A4C1U2P3_EUMVA|nr:hypothetical protein EVAR_78928_1 [Eumeta japonica]
MRGLSSGLIQALQSLYRGSSACVKINGTYTDWFDIRSGVRQACVASPWLFNLFMDICLYDLKEYVILAPSACGLQEMVNKMNDSFKKRGMKANVGKTKLNEVITSLGDGLQTQPAACDAASVSRPRRSCVWRMPSRRFGDGAVLFTFSYSFPIAYTRFA